MKTYRPYSPEQSYLLPPSPREWLPKEHLAFFILGLIQELDLSAIEKVVQAKDPRGERPYSPEMMTSLLLYAYATGVYSSRRIEEDALHGAYDPKEEIRLREERLAKMARAKEALKKEVAAARAVRLREQAVELRKTAEDMTRTPKNRAQAATLAKKRDQQASLFDDDSQDPPAPSPDVDLPRNVPPHRPDGMPKPKAQRNFTDPESRIMVRDGAFIQAYNAQLAVDEEHQIIVAAAVSNQGPDNEYFEPMLRRVVENCDAVPETATADNGYFSEAAIRYAEHIGVEPFISAGKHRNDGTQDTTSELPQHRTDPKLRMRALLETERGRENSRGEKRPSNPSSARSAHHGASVSFHFAAY